MSIRGLATTALFATVVLLSKTAAEPSWINKVGEVPMESAGAVFGFAWSPDSRYAIFFNGSRTPWLIDVQERSVVTIAGATSCCAQASAWSPNGQLIAVRYSGAHIHLVSFPKFERITYRPQLSAGRLTRNCWFTTNALAFTPDGRFLWAGCAARDERDRFTIAVKLSVPDLEIVEEADAVVPETGNRTIATIGTFSADASNGKIYYYSLARVFNERPKDSTRDGFADRRDYLLAIDLQNKSQVVYNIPDSLPSVGKLITHPDGIVGYFNYELTLKSPSEKPYTSRIVLYLLKDRQDTHLLKFDIDSRVVHFRSQDMMLMSPAELFTDTELLIGKRGPENEPGVVTKIALNGSMTSIRKEVTRFHGFSVSPNRRHLLTITDHFRTTLLDRIISALGGNEVLIYLGLWRPGPRGPHSGVEMYSFR
jgi:hypothetical protein